MSLAWGGLYGLKKIKIQGFWDQFVYEKDEYDNPIYWRKEQISKEDYEKIQNDAAAAQSILESGEEVENKQQLLDQISLMRRTEKFICPCDNEIKYVLWSAGPGRYKHSKWSSDSKSTLKEVDNTNGHFLGVSLERENKPVRSATGQIIKIYTVDYFNKIIKQKMERAEIIVNNFGSFSFKNLKINSTDEDYEITAQQADYIDYSVKDIEHSVLQYSWKDCEMRMLCKSNEKDLAVNSDVDFCYQSFYLNNNKRILFQDKNEDYYSALDFYSIAKKVITDADGYERIVTIPVLLGTFYIVEDFNIPVVSEEYAVQSVDGHLKDVRLIETFTQRCAARPFAINVDKNIKSYNYSQMPEHKQSTLTVYYNPQTMQPYEPNAHTFVRADGSEVHGNLKVFSPDENYFIYRRQWAPAYQALGQQIEVNAKNFPGVFKLVGETYARDRLTGKDQHLQIEIPLCKLSSNTNLVLEADGEPSTLEMSLKVLRKENGQMMKITRYETEECDPTQTIIPYDVLENVSYIYEAPLNHKIQLLAPQQQEVFCIEHDCRIKKNDYIRDNQSATYLRLPTAAEKNLLPDITSIEDFDYQSFEKEHRNLILIAEIDSDNKIVGWITADMVTDLSIEYGE